MTDHETIQRGHTAKRILDDPVFQEAASNAYDRIVAEWESAETAEAREEAHATLRGMKRFLTQFRGFLDDADMAVHRQGQGQQ